MSEGTTLFCSVNPCAGCEHCERPCAGCERCERASTLPPLTLELADYVRLHYTAFRYGRTIEDVETDYL